jgi:hypothetical protein
MEVRKVTNLDDDCFYHFVVEVIKTLWTAGYTANSKSISKKKRE